MTDLNDLAAALDDGADRPAGGDVERVVDLVVDVGGVLAPEENPASIALSHIRWR